MELKVKKSDIRKWCDALRSGYYRQGVRQLQSLNGSFCCLGVACDLFIPEEKKELRINKSILNGGLPIRQKHAPYWLKAINRDFYRKTNIQIVELNDNKGFNFNELADLIEAVYIHEVLD